MKPKAVVFDLDGTLCKERSIAYAHDGDELPNYLIIEEKIKFWDPLNISIVILTGRKRKEFGAVTEKWLQDNKIFHDQLIMQEGNTAEKNHIYKEKELLKLQEKYDIVIMFDDNPDLVDVCKRLNIPLYLV